MAMVGQHFHFALSAIQKPYFSTKKGLCLICSCHHCASNPLGAVHKGYPTFQLVSRFVKMGYEDI